MVHAPLLRDVTIAFWRPMATASHSWYRSECHKRTNSQSRDPEEDQLVSRLAHLKHEAGDDEACHDKLEDEVGGSRQRRDVPGLLVLHV